MPTSRARKVGRVNRELRLRAARAVRVGRWHGSRTHAAMTFATKRSHRQPRPRERPERDIEPDQGIAPSPTPEPEAQAEEEAEPNPPDMGVGPDERGEIDRRNEP